MEIVWTVCGGWNGSNCSDGIEYRPLKNERNSNQAERIAFCTQYPSGNLLLISAPHLRVCLLPGWLAGSLTHSSVICFYFIAFLPFSPVFYPVDMTPFKFYDMVIKFSVSVHVAHDVKRSIEIVQKEAYALNSLSKWTHIQLHTNTTKVRKGDSWHSRNLK